MSKKEHKRVRLLWLECPLHSRTKNQALMGRDQAEGLARGTEGLRRAPPQSKSIEKACGLQHLGELRDGCDGFCLI